MADFARQSGDEGPKAPDSALLGHMGGIGHGGSRRLDGGDCDGFLGRRRVRVEAVYFQDAD